MDNAEYRAGRGTDRPFDEAAAQRAWFECNQAEILARRERDKKLKRSHRRQVGWRTFHLDED